MHNNHHILQAQQLKKKYRQKTAVNDLSLSLKSHEIVGLLGPNGAGKTTSFYMIVGLIRPSSGHLLLNDQDITQSPMHQRARAGISYLPQEPSIFRKLSAENNILALLELDKKTTKKQRTERLEQLLHQFDLIHIRHIPGFQLSGGERRRVEIARALCLNPKFLLLDEPFAGIDPISIAALKTMMTNLAQQGIGILITDHNVRETLDICHRAYIFNQGDILAQGEPQTLLTNETVKKVYLGQAFSL